MNLLFGLIIGTAIVVIVVALYFALIIAGRSDEETSMENNEGADNMFFRKQICPRCKTGKYTYDLDPKSDACPYIGSWRCNKCSFYKPLEKEPKNGVSNGFKNKRSLPSPEKIRLYSGLK